MAKNYTNNNSFLFDSNVETWQVEQNSNSNTIWWAPAIEAIMNNSAEVIVNDIISNGVIHLA